MYGPVVTKKLQEINNTVKVVRNKDSSANLGECGEPKDPILSRGPLSSAANASPLSSMTPRLAQDLQR